MWNNWSTKMEKVTHVLKWYMLYEKETFMYYILIVCMFLLIVLVKMGKTEYYIFLI
jgi:hypothetical protein